MSQNNTNPPETNSEEPKEPQTVNVPEKEFAKLKEEANEYKNKYLQQLADAENARKRLQRERAEISQYAIKNILLDFLHPIDHLENALKFTDQASDEIKHWALGFKMISNQFKDVLVNNGVLPLEAEGKEFDPHLHEAIEMIITTEHPEGIVIEESTKGYMIGDKPLRPARVKVSKAPDNNGQSKI